MIAPAAAAAASPCPPDSGAMIRAQLMRFSFSFAILTQLPPAWIDLSQVLRQVSTSTVEGMLV